MMIPAKITCPSNWTEEYHGFLMTEQYNHHSTEFVCVDRTPKIRDTTAPDDNGALFYPVEGGCNAGNLPCGPYLAKAELTCVVCSR